MTAEKQQKVLNAPIWSSLQKKTKAASKFSKLLLIKLLPPESTTGRRNEHKDSRSVLPSLKPERSR